MSFAARTGAIAGVGARALTPRRARGSRSQARGGSPAPACVTNASTALGTWTPTPDGLRRRARCHAVDSTAGLLASMDEQDPPPIDAGADLDGVVILNGSVDDPETGASATTSIDDDDDDDEPIFSGELFARLVRFTLPTMAIWLSGPILSMVDTAVVGTASTLELAAMTPGGVYVDYPSYLLSSSLAVATTTLVAQERMRKKKKTRVNAKGELEDGGRWNVNRLGRRRARRSPRLGCRDFAVHRRGSRHCKVRWAQVRGGGPRGADVRGDTMRRRAVPVGGVRRAGFVPRV